MENRRIVSREEWLVARKRHLKREKDFTKLRDELSSERRDLPWVELDKSYSFHTESGRKTLADLFGNHSQLLVYHFMFGPDWDEGCKSCSFWADNYDGTAVHLSHRDVGFVAVSIAPLPKLLDYRERMGWSFDWVSSEGSDFNRDFQVSFTAEEMEKGETVYNYETRPFPSEEAPGVSVFYKDGNGSVFHTYSCYARGLDMLNGAYHLLDLVPKGRDEQDLAYSMAWLRHHDRYESSSGA